MTGKHWEVNNPGYSPPVAGNTGRITGLSYNAAGNIMSEPVPYVTGDRTYTFDAAGRNTSGVDPGSRTLQYAQNLTTNYDGNGWRMKHQSVHSTSGYTKTTYEFSSTVLDGETVGEWSFDNNSGPEYKKFFSTANGVKMKYLSQATFYDWEWMSPEGTTVYGGFGTTATAEFDPRGGGLGTENPYSGGGGGYGGGGNHGDAEHYQVCQWDGSPVSCGVAQKIAFKLNPRLRRQNEPAPQPNGVDSPTTMPPLPPGIEKPNNRADSSALAFAVTTATDKTADRPDKADPVEPTSVPDNDPESEKNRKERMWSVNVTDDRHEVLTTSDPQTEIIPLPKDLEQLVKGRAGAGTPCGDAIVRLVDKLAENTRRKKFKQSDKDKRKGLSYVESLFKRVKGKIKLDSSLPPFEANTGSTDFYLGGAKITMGAATTEYMKERGLTPGQINDRYVFTTLHELVHNAAKNGRYSDPEVLSAAIDILKADGHTAPAPTNNIPNASSRINTFFGIYCPNPK